MYTVQQSSCDVVLLVCAFLSQSTSHTPLLVACEFGYHYIVQALVTAGANVKHSLHVSGM